MPIIALTTDFGSSDWFVGSMKGVILGINPQVTIVDLTHEIPAGDIRAGAFALAASYKCFPRLTVHCAVVDPGVGSERAPIAVKTSDYWFVGPDNGVLSFALAQEKVREVRRLDNDEYFRKPVSHTFHGRDIFAPAAAHLSNGVPMNSLGSEVNEFVRVAWPQVNIDGGVTHGQVIYIDRFGNCITNISSVASNVRVAGRIECPVKKFYQEVPSGQPLAMMGSTGFLEIAVNGGHAAKALGLKLGDVVEVL